MILIYCLWIYITPSLKINNEFPAYYFVVLCIFNIVDYSFWYGISLSQVSFFARISDEVIGATYMTFLNTMSNLGKILN